MGNNYDVANARAYRASISIPVYGTDIGRVVYYVSDLKTGEVNEFVIGYVNADGSGRAAMTLLLWLPYFMCLLMLFFMYNWWPSLMGKTGLPISAALFATVLFNLGRVVDPWCTTA